MADPASPTMTDGSGNPSPPKPRMFVLCFDGTTNEFDGDNTNVVKLFAMLRKDCETEQLCYYQAGIGTYENPGIFTPLALWVAKILDEAIAWYLDAHVMGGYKFLMQNWRVGDKVSIFGFSRGAYTARALAGMLTKIGLLPRDNVEQVPFAYKMYTRTDKDGLVQAKGFKQTFCREVEIEFLGVWDTVASTGVIMSRTLPFTTNNASIKTFRHALSLDEHRAKFVPTFYHRPTPSVSADQNDPEHSAHASVPTPPLAAGASAKATKTTAGKDGTEAEDAKRKSVVPLGPNGVNGEEPETHLLGTQKAKVKVGQKRTWSVFSKGNNKTASASAADPDEVNGNASYNVKEVWFAGCHSDVGGGNDKNDVAHSLADIPLRWMVQEIIRSQCGIQFDTAAMERLNVPTSLPPTPSHNPIPLNGGASAPTPAPVPSLDPPLSPADAADAIQQLHDSLKSQPLWWLLEIIPMPFSWQDKAGVWRKKWMFHMGRGRYVNASEQLLFHVSVKARMADPTLGYTPRAQYTKGSEKYTD